MFVFSQQVLLNSKYCSAIPIDFGIAFEESADYMSTREYLMLHYPNFHCQQMIVMLNLQVSDNLADRVHLDKTEELSKFAGIYQNFCYFCYAY